MTREEAVAILIRERDEDPFSGTEYREQIHEALNMAIEALEQEPSYYPPCIDCHKKMDEIRRAYDKLKEQEPCEDAISRQAALGCCRNEWEEEVEIRLKSLPSVTSQQKYEDIAKAFQFGLAFGFGKKYDEMDMVIDEIKKVITPQTQESCDDVVSRHEVKEQMIKYGFHAPDMTVTEFVKDLPPVNPQEPCDVFDEYGNYKYPSDVELTEPNTATSMPCEDAISREAARDLMYHKQDLLDEYDLDSLPSVTPKPKTGHWIRELIRNEKGGCIGAKMICSECGNDNKHDEYMNYCPNCGARMIEPQEGEG